MQKQFNTQLPTTPDVLDRRVQRTREALRVALMQLMVEVGWDAIDVQTLCTHANIGRSTFYQHFPNKEELLKANFAGLRDALLGQRMPAVPAVAVPGQLNFVAGLVEHVHEAQDVFRALVGRRSGHYVQDRFRELLVEMVQADLTTAKQRPARTQGAWQQSAQAHYLGGALFEMLAWWLGRNRTQKPQEIVALFHQWSAPVLIMETRA